MRILADYEEMIKVREHYNKHTGKATLSLRPSNERMDATNQCVHSKALTRRPPAANGIIYVLHSSKGVVEESLAMRLEDLHFQIEEITDRVLRGSSCFTRTLKCYSGLY